MADLEETFDYFVGQCQDLAAIYRTLRVLFLDSQDEVIPILNRTAPSFFTQLLQVYSSAVFLGMARLGDKAESGSNRNISVERVRQLVEKRGLLTSEIEQCADLLRIENYPDLSRLRRKHLAHLDEPTIVAAKGIDIPSWSRIRDYFLNLKRFVNLTNIQLYGREQFRFVPSNGEGVFRLIEILDASEVDGTKPPLTPEMFHRVFGDFEI